MDFVYDFLGFLSKVHKIQENSLRVLSDGKTPIFLFLFVLILLSLLGRLNKPNLGLGVITGVIHSFAVLG